MGDAHLRSSSNKLKYKKYEPKNYSAKLPSHTNKELEELVEPHVGSFNFFLDEGLKLAVSDLEKVEYESDSGRIVWWIENAHITHPCDSRENKVLPHTVRLSSIEIGKYYNLTVS
jgi:hypothetical protein